MKKRPYRRLLVFLLLVIVPLLAIVTLTRPLGADGSKQMTAKALDRDLEPVIITGATVPVFNGRPLNQLFAYRFAGGVWQQIPAQVDEVTASGAYTTTEDALLDADDEIVFMTKDLGDQAPGDPRTAEGFPDVAIWYELEVTDPISPTQKGWAYLIHSSELTQTFTADYVSFNTTLHRINGTSYSLGFGTTHPAFEYLALGRSSVDILDRTKIRLYCSVPLICPITEDKLRPLPDNLIKDGPVRVIVRGGRGLAYHSLVSWTTSYVNIPLFAGDMRFTTDFTPAVSGTTFYNAAVPAGVTVDGITDTVAAEPFSPWWQLSTGMGTAIQVADTSPIGGNQTNYYVDDATWDSSDTGDRRHYGDTGIHITSPNLSFTYTFAIYFLPGSQPNVGETYAAYFSQPLVVTAQLQELELPVKVYLPTIQKGAATSSTSLP